MYMCVYVFKRNEVETKLTEIEMKDIVEFGIHRSTTFQISFILILPTLNMCVYVCVYVSEEWSSQYLTT